MENEKIIEIHNVATGEITRRQMTEEELATLPQHSPIGGETIAATHDNN